MKPEARRAFAAWISAIPSVRSCLMDREADFVARTWSATVTQIIVLDELVKPRQIRRIIGDNSRVGVGTLFLLSAALMPPDSLKLEPPETLLALHALHRDKIYTYAEISTGLQIGQVHFRSFGRVNEYETWHGPAVEVQSLPCFRVWVKSPASIKGDWLMATFGSEAFWKQAEYTMGREAMRRQQRGGFTHQAAWSASGNGKRVVEDEEAAPPRPGLRAPVRLNRLETCYAQLGVPGGATSDEVKAAYRRLARELHPDVSALPKSEAEIRFRILHEAYTFIKISKGW